MKYIFFKIIICVLPQYKLYSRYESSPDYLNKIHQLKSQFLPFFNRQSYHQHHMLKSTQLYKILLLGFYLHIPINHEFTSC